MALPLLFRVASLLGTHSRPRGVIPRRRGRRALPSPARRSSPTSGIVVSPVAPRLAQSGRRERFSTRWGGTSRVSRSERLRALCCALRLRCLCLPRFPALAKAAARLRRRAIVAFRATVQRPIVHDGSPVTRAPCCRCQPSFRSCSPEEHKG